MSPSDKEGSPITPDGSLLSLLGDLIFAGAILVMIYPCLRKTVSRIDRNFFRQFFHILEIILAVVALCFVLMLLIAQQMRITYCSLIRPYVGDTEEDKAYAGMLLKILVCVLLLFNYFCASGLQRVVRVMTERFQGADSRPRRLPSARAQRSRYLSFGDALTNNSNTNSQTPVTQTQSVTLSDILPSMSSPELNSNFCQRPDTPVTEQNRSLRRDVGTMVRFPEQTSSPTCTFQFRSYAGETSYPTSATTESIAHRYGPCKSASGARQSAQGRPSGFGAISRSTYPHVFTTVDNYPRQEFASVQSSARCSRGLSSIKSCLSSYSSSCHGSCRNGASFPSPHSNYHLASDQSSMQSSVGVDSNHRAASSSSGTDSSPSSCQSCYSGLNLTRTQSIGQNSPRLVVSIHKGCQRDQGLISAQSRPQSASRLSHNAQSKSQIPYNSGGAQSWCFVDQNPASVHNRCNVSVGPSKASSSCHVGLCPTMIAPSSENRPVVSSGNGQGGAGPSLVETSGAGPNLVETRCHSEHDPAAVGTSHAGGMGPSFIETSCQCSSRQDGSQVVAQAQSWCRNDVASVVCSCERTWTNASVPKKRGSGHIRKRCKLPPMPKMTRSGKIYGYG